MPATRCWPWARYRTLRFTDHHLEVEPAVVAATVAGLLRGTGP